MELITISEMRIRLYVVVVQQDLCVTQSSLIKGGINPVEQQTYSCLSCCVSCRDLTYTYINIIYCSHSLHAQCIVHYCVPLNPLSPDPVE